MKSLIEILRKTKGILVEVAPITIIALMFAICATLVFWLMIWLGQHLLK